MKKNALDWLMYAWAACLIFFGILFAIAAVVTVFTRYL